MASLVHPGVRPAAAHVLHKAPPAFDRHDDLADDLVGDDLGFLGCGDLVPQDDAREPGPHDDSPATGENRLNSHGFDQAPRVLFFYLLGHNPLLQVAEGAGYAVGLRRQCDVPALSTGRGSTHRRLVNGYGTKPIQFARFEMVPERSGDASSQAHVSASPRKRSRAGAAETPATLSPIRRGDRRSGKGEPWALGACRRAGTYCGARA